MSSTNFVDHVKVYCRSGKGGAGSVHFRREKFVPKGGPDGGDGGRGGHIILRGNAQLWTLLHLRYTRHIMAGNGVNGAGAHKTGAYGEDRIIEVPLGTLVKDAESGKMLAEITKDGEERILLEGGRGGLGNLNFKSATHQTPRHAQPGEEGKEAWVVLELKLLADVGLVGFPNAGKSTLLSALSAARPEIADYPFTTLVPNLGVVAYRGEQSFVMADIPGIIEGAHEGKGLGDRFLRHIERNPVLLFMVPCDSNDPVQDYKTLLNELNLFNPGLVKKKRVLGISKCDMLDAELEEELRKDLKKALPRSLPVVFFSGVSGVGLPQLKDELWKHIKK